MKKYAHNFTELTALIKEAIQNGSIYDLDDTQWITHGTELHIADIYIGKDSEVVARTYNDKKGSINHKVLGRVI